jgi:hypothetical protein
MVSCKAVGPGVSTGDEAGGGVDEESGAGVDMVMGGVGGGRSYRSRFLSKRYEQCRDRGNRVVMLLRDHSRSLVAFDRKCEANIGSNRTTTKVRLRPLKQDSQRMISMYSI